LIHPQLKVGIANQRHPFSLAATTHRSSSSSPVIFSREVNEIIGSQQPKEYRGSYSILASSSSATVAKIIIYESGKGKKWKLARPT